MNKIKIALSIAAIVITVACNSTKKTVTNPPDSTTTENLSAKDLETFLTVKYDYIKIPITKLASGHLHVNVKVNGIDGEFVLDTGAGATVIDIKRKSKFNLKIETTDEVGAGAGGNFSVNRSPENKLNIGDLEIQDFTAFVMSLDEINNGLVSMGLKELDGVIGADILTSNQGIIDYSKLILYLRK